MTKYVEKWKGVRPCIYRPITVLPVLSKVIERQIYNSLYTFPGGNGLLTFLNDYSLVHSRQPRFRKQHSTKTALVKITDDRDLLFNLGNDTVSGMLLVDYRKAFDMVELLLKKLSSRKQVVH